MWEDLGLPGVFQYRLLIRIGNSLSEMSTLLMNANNGYMLFCEDNSFILELLLKVLLLLLVYFVFILFF